MSIQTPMPFATLAQIIMTDPICEISDCTQIRLSQDTTRYPFNERTPVRMTQLVLGLAAEFSVRNARGIITLRSGIKVRLMSDGVQYDYIAPVTEVAEA